MKYTPIDDRDPLIEKASAADFNTDKNNQLVIPVSSNLRNIINNPFFRIAEKGMPSSEAVTGVHSFFDTWEITKAGTASLAITGASVAPSGFSYVQGVDLSIGSTGTMSIEHLTALNVDDAKFLMRNKSVRLSALVVSSRTDLRIKIKTNSATYYSEYNSSPYSWEKLTVDIPAIGYNPTSVEVGLDLGGGTPVSVTAGDYIQHTGYVLSLQDDFEAQPLSYDEELARCREALNVSTGQSIPDNANMNGAVEIDLTEITVVDYTLTATSTLEFLNAKGGQSGFFGVKQDGSTVYGLSATGTTLYGTTLDAPDAVSKIDHWSYAVHDFSGTIYIVLSKLANFTGL